MTITVMGAAGRTGRRIASLLVAQGRPVRAVVRRADDLRSLELLGAEAVQGDLTAGASMLASVIAHNDVVINAAGVSSPHSPELHDVDRDGAIAAIRAAEAVGVRRFIQISAMPADRPDRAPAGFRTYLRAKNASDTALASSRLVWTVVRPGALVDRRGKGRVMVGTDLRSGSIPRDDLAALVVGCLAQSATCNRGFDVVSGRQPIDVALASVA